MVKCLQGMTLGIFLSLLLCFNCRLIFAQEALVKNELAETLEEPFASGGLEERLEVDEPVSPDEAERIRQAAARGVEDEVKAFGAFEIDRPDADTLLKLSLVQVHREVRSRPDGMYVVSSDFRDEDGTPYVVDLYLEAFEGGDYEILDAVLAPSSGEPIGEGEQAP